MPSLFAHDWRASLVALRAQHGFAGWGAPSLKRVGRLRVRFRVATQRRRPPAIAERRSNYQVNHDLRAALLALFFKKRQRSLNLGDPAGGHRDQQVPTLSVF